MGGEQEHARAVVSRVDHLAGCVLRSELDRMRTLAEFRNPLGLPGQKAPVVGDADRVNGIDVWAGLRAGIDEAAFRVGTGDDGRYAHVEIGVGLCLGIHAGKAVNQPGDKKFARAVNDDGVFGNGNLVRQADIGDASGADDDNSAGKVACRIAPTGEVDNSAAGKNQRGGRYGGLRLRLGRNRGQSTADHKQTREKAEQAHG